MAAIPRIHLGLALGGGGARGLAHIGVLKVLERAGFKIEYLAGTSMGGLIAVAYASGASAAEIEAEALKRGSKREIVKLVDFTPPTRGLVKGRRIYNQLADILGAELNFSDLKIPTALVTVDILTGRQVILSTGRVVDAVRATISLPGLFFPVDYESYLLVDGGLLNNVPVDVVRGLGAKQIIAIDVLPNFSANIPGNPPEVLPLNPGRLPQSVKDIINTELIMVSAMTVLNLQVSKPDLVIRPQLPPDLDILFSFERVSEAIAAGEQAAEEALPQIHNILGRSSVG